MDEMPEVQFCLHVSVGWNFILHVAAATQQGYFNERSPEWKMWRMWKAAL